MFFVRHSGGVQLFNCLWFFHKGMQVPVFTGCWFNSRGKEGLQEASVVSFSLSSYFELYICTLSRGDHIKILCLSQKPFCYWRGDLCCHLAQHWEYFLEIFKALLFLNIEKESSISYSQTDPWVESSLWDLPNAVCVCISKYKWKFLIHLNCTRKKSVKFCSISVWK